MTSRLSVWPPLPLGVYVRRPAADLPFPLDDPRCRVFVRARHGLWHGVRAIGLQLGDEVLAPAYHHGSEIEALVRRGLVCRFYEAHETLEPDSEELDSLIGPRTRALYLTHYLGFAQDLRRWRQWCDERQLLLIEDAAQAWLATRDGLSLGSVGDLSIFCLYKTFGVPGGGALLCSVPPPLDPAGGPDVAKILIQHAAWVAGRSDSAARAVRWSRPPKPYVPEEDFALGEPSAPSSALEFLLRRVVDRGAAATRRAHYELLLAELSELVAPAFAAMQEGASPFAFPVATLQKAELLERLRSNGVNALDFWSVPNPILPAHEFPGAMALRRSIVALPVHQELRPQDIERVVRAVHGRPSPQPKLRIELLPTLDSARGEWALLAEQTDNIFATWDWNSTWWRHFGRDSVHLVSACRASDGSLVAILPLYLSRERPIRLVRFIGAGQGDHLAPICPPSRRGVAALALRQALLEHRADLFIGENVPADDGWGALLGGKVVRRTGSPVLRFRGASWEDLLARGSHNFRAQVRRRERKLAREHGICFRLADDRDSLDQDLDILFALHAARWGKGGTWLSAEFRAFHREFAHCAFDRGWLRLWILEASGTPVAAWQGFRFGGAESYYQAGRDPGWNRYSVGFILLIHSIRQALEDGMREYRFLEGREQYKYRFASEDAGLETIALARGVPAEAALAAIRGVPGLAHLGRRLAD